MSAVISPVLFVLGLSLAASAGETDGPSVPWSPGTALPRPLVDAIDEAAVVGIGESHHGVQAFQALRRDLILRLVEDHDVRMFGIEASPTHALLLDDWVARQDCGNPEDVRAGWTFPAWQSREHDELLEALCVARRDRGVEVSFFGFDPQFADVAASHLTTWLRSGALPEGETLAGELSACMQSPDRPATRADVRSDLTPERASEEAAPCRRAFADIRAAAERAFREGHAFPTPADVDQVLAEIEQGDLLNRMDAAGHWAARAQRAAGMAALALPHLESASPTHRAVLIAHTGHLMPAPEDWYGRELGDFGVLLEGVLGSEYAFVGLFVKRVEGTPAALQRKGIRRLAPAGGFVRAQEITEAGTGVVAGADWCGERPHRTWVATMHGRRRARTSVCALDVLITVETSALMPPG